MLYSTLLAATAAFSGLVAAQNDSSQYQLPAGFETCCSVPANTVPDSTKTSWCNAQENTCPEICGGQGQIASGGNECDDSTLQFTCKCRNGTEPNMDLYQQSVPGLMCRFWFDACQNATIVNGQGNSAQQYGCRSLRDTRCGNLTADGEAAETSGSGSSDTTSSATSRGGSSPTSSSASSSGETAGAAIRLAQEYGTPLFAGGMMALAGLAL